MEIFVPGRLCLFGEHSDWAGLYHRANDQIEPGMAVVTGIDQGIYANAEHAASFRFRTVRENGEHGDWVEWPLSARFLKTIAESGGYYAYVAGTAAFMLEQYNVSGLSIDINKVTLPIKKGFSSSAAICVLVARAFNRLYNLRLSVRGEMEAAYHGEIMTPSRCGRLDQACAYGNKPVLIRFASENIDVETLEVGSDLHWVFADLKGEKDTRKILSDLNACYPYARDSIAENVQKALGPENRRICEQVIEAMRMGDAARIGCLMDESQRIFDEWVAPACTSELLSPILSRVLSDHKVRELALGAKGVGSHGDGAVQMICKNAADKKQLRDYLNECGMNAYAFTIRKQHNIRQTSAKEVKLFNEAGGIR